MDAPACTHTHTPTKSSRLDPTAQILVYKAVNYLGENKWQEKWYDSKHAGDSDTYTQTLFCDNQCGSASDFYTRVFGIKILAVCRPSEIDVLQI